MSAEKTERQLHLLMHLLNAQETVSWENIKTEVRGYQVGDEKTLHRKFDRDKKELRDAGFTIETGFHHFYGENAGYFLKPSSLSFKLPPLSEKERNLLFLLCHLFRKPGAFPFAETLLFSLAKLKALASEDDSAPPEMPAGSERVFMTPKSSQHDAPKISVYLRKIYDAVQKQKKISFLYQTPDSEKTEKRMLRSYVLYCRQGVWYVAGYSEERKGDRIFRMSRMKCLSVNAKNSSQPDYEIPRDFDLQKLLFKETYMAGKKESFPVRVRFSKEIAWLAQRHFAPQPKISETKHGEKIFSLEIKNMKAFARKLLPYREHVNVVQPVELKKCVRSELLTLKERLQGRGNAAKPA